MRSRAGQRVVQGQGLGRGKREREAGGSRTSRFIRRRRGASEGRDGRGQWRIVVVVDRYRCLVVRRSGHLVGRVGDDGGPDMAVGLVAVVVHGGHGERLAGRVGGEKRDGPLTQLRGGGEVSLLFEAHPRLEVRARDPVQRHGERGGGPFCHCRAAGDAHRVLDRRIEQPDDAVARPGTCRSAVQVRDAEAGRAARGRGGNAHRDGVVRLVRVAERFYGDVDELALDAGAGKIVRRERCRVR